jgi:hypothetical protein
MVERIVAKGTERGELRANTDPAAVATLLTATLEGAIMLSKLYDDTSYMLRAVQHLNWYIDSVLAQ